MWQHKQMERLHLFTAAGTNSFTARSKSTLLTLTISLYCPKCSLRTWNMHSQNNKAMPFYKIVWPLDWKRKHKVPPGLRFADTPRNGDAVDTLFLKPICLFTK